MRPEERATFTALKFQLTSGNKHTGLNGKGSKNLLLASISAARWGEFSLIMLFQHVLMVRHAHSSEDRYWIVLPLNATLLDLRCDHSVIRQLHACPDLRCLHMPPHCGTKPEHSNWKLQNLMTLVNAWWSSI